MKEKITQMPADYFVKSTGISRKTFYNRVASTNVSYIEPFNGQRYYSVKDWNKKNPDYEISIDNVAQPV